MKEIIEKLKCDLEYCQKRGSRELPSMYSPSEAEQIIHGLEQAEKMREALEEISKVDYSRITFNIAALNAVEIAEQALTTLK